MSANDRAAPGSIGLASTRPVVRDPSRARDEVADTAALGSAPSPPPGFQAPAFAPGDRVADRYCITRFVAQGGMGEVYEADDIELGVRVALKTVRTEASQDGRTVARFKREIRLARQVTHPNVCRTFDLGIHHAHDAGAGHPAGVDVTFLTMELLEGETLGHRIRRQGRIETAEALPLARQIAAGLAAAHRVGIVHRDLKSDNVLLVPDTAETGGLRAVVMDFGLARTTLTASTSASLSATGTIVGTPEYMAPEQVEGQEASEASDLYSFGVVLYEMATGRLPFPTRQAAMETAIARLTQDPTPPRELVPDLDRRLEAAIVRCLRRRPADRFTGAREVLEALNGGTHGQQVGPRRRHGRRAAVVLALLLAAAGAALMVRHAVVPATRTVPAAGR